VVLWTIDNPRITWAVEAGAAPLPWLHGAIVGLPYVEVSLTEGLSWRR
jgi:hypothetical protein